jgi:hypothetical protein
MKLSRELSAVLTLLLWDELESGDGGMRGICTLPSVFMQCNPRHRQDDAEHGIIRIPGASSVPAVALVS